MVTLVMRCPTCGLSADLDKRNMAIEHDEMAADVMMSINDWVLEGAIKGKQRHFYIENPTKSVIWDRPYMVDFMELSGLKPQRCNYCCYQIMLTDPLVYPTPKSARILTNVSGWVRDGCHAGAAQIWPITMPTPPSSLGPTLKSGPRSLTYRRSVGGGDVCVHDPRGTPPRHRSGRNAKIND